MSINTTISSNYPKYENNHHSSMTEVNNSNTIIKNEKSTDNIYCNFNYFYFFNGC